LIKAHYDGGIYIELDNVTLLADPLSYPKRRVDAILISHAHTDHYSPSVLLRTPTVPKIMSSATYDLIASKKRLRNVHLVGPGESIEISGVTIEALEAGHIIGSIQFVIHGRQIVAYTGDINLERRVILKPATIARADVLIIEATYGKKDYSFPPRSELYRNLLAIVKEHRDRGKPLLLRARQLGVAQEVTALLALSGFALPLVHPAIERYNKFYEERGVSLGPYAVAFKAEIPEPIIMPLNSSKRGLPCTGWAAKWLKGLPISSHSGFDQLVRYALESGAEKIFTVYGFSQELASYLSNEGLDAEPLPRRA